MSKMIKIEELDIDECAEILLITPMKQVDLGSVLVLVVENGSGGEDIVLSTMDGRAARITLSS